LRRRAGEESEEPIVPMKAVKAAGGKGRLYPAKRLWQGRIGDCGDTSNAG
jgi:hypothetical protein